EEPDRNVVALALVAMLCSALATEAMGVHAIFGAFLLGAVIPHDSRLARVLEERIEYLVTILLLPAFLHLQACALRLVCFLAGTIGSPVRRSFSLRRQASSAAPSLARVSPVTNGALPQVWPSS